MVPQAHPSSQPSAATYQRLPVARRAAVTLVFACPSCAANVRVRLAARRGDGFGYDRAACAQCGAPYAVVLDAIVLSESSEEGAAPSPVRPTDAEMATDVGQ